DPTHYPALTLAIRTGVLCNDARMREEENLWRVEGDPTEGALLVLCGKTGFPQHLGEAAWPRRDAIPFESQHSFIATYHHDSDGQPWIFTKGAPERILSMCTTQWQHNGEQPLDTDYWRQMVTRTAAQGLRLLALACKCSPLEGDSLGLTDMKTGFT